MWREGEGWRESRNLLFSWKEGRRERRGGGRPSLPKSTILYPSSNKMIHAIYPLNIRKDHLSLKVFYEINIKEKKSNKTSIYSSILLTLLISYQTTQKITIIFFIPHILHLSNSLYLSFSLSLLPNGALTMQRHLTSVYHAKVIFNLLTSLCA